MLKHSQAQKRSDELSFLPTAHGNCLGGGVISICLNGSLVVGLQILLESLLITQSLMYIVKEVQLSILAVSLVMSSRYMPVFQTWLEHSPKSHPQV
jgi:hypothetical protein